MISDVPKTLVYRIARWLNRDDREVIPPGHHRQTALRRAPARSEGRGQPAALRGARRDPRGVTSRREHRSSRSSSAASTGAWWRTWSAWSTGTNTNASRQRPASASRVRRSVRDDAYRSCRSFARGKGRGRNGGIAAWLRSLSRGTIPVRGGRSSEGMNRLTRCVVRHGRQARP